MNLLARIEQLNTDAAAFRYPTYMPETQQKRAMNPRPTQEWYAERAKKMALLSCDGWSYRKIGLEFGISGTQVQHHIRRYYSLFHLTPL